MRAIRQRGIGLIELVVAGALALVLGALACQLLLVDSGTGWLAGMRARQQARIALMMLANDLIHAGRDGCQPVAPDTAVQVKAFSRSAVLVLRQCRDAVPLALSPDRPWQSAGVPFGVSDPVFRDWSLSSCGYPSLTVCARLARQRFWLQTPLPARNDAGAPCHHYPSLQASRCYQIRWYLRGGILWREELPGAVQAMLGGDPRVQLILRDHDRQVEIRLNERSVTIALNRHAS